MSDINVLAVLVSTIGAFVLSGVWYATLSDQLAKLNKIYADESKMPAWEIGMELLRSFFVAIVVAILFSKLGTTGLGSSLLYGLALWLAFPVVLLVGSVIHEKVPTKLAAIHAVDWLIKLLLIISIITVWN